MDFSDFLKLTDTLKTTKLGGLEAHFKLAPELRLRFDEERIQSKNPIKAAVLVLFYPNKNNQTCFLVTERASYKGTHSAQISFPGGKKDSTDASLKETALRETFEEVGIQQELVTLFRELTDTYIPPSNFLVTPFLGYTTKKPVFQINYEVEKIIEILVSDLLNDQNISTTTISNSYTKNATVPCFNINKTIIWGATGMMLSEIKGLLMLKVL